MHDHLKSAFSVHVQSSFGTHKMIDCAHPLPDHHPGDRHPLSCSGMALLVEVVETKGWPVVHLTSDQNLHSTTPTPSPCFSLLSITQSAEQAHDRAYVHLHCQMLVGLVPFLQLLSVLFALLVHLPCVLPLDSASLPIQSFSTLVLP